MNPTPTPLSPQVQEWRDKLRAAIINLPEGKSFNPAQMTPSETRYYRFGHRDARYAAAEIAAAHTKPNSDSGLSGGRASSEGLQTALPDGDFAKIVRASDCAQVLFRKGQDEEGNPCLFQATDFDGAQADMNISFVSGDWAALDLAFDAAGTEQADDIRAACAKFFTDAKGQQ